MCKILFSLILGFISLFLISLPIQANYVKPMSTSYKHVKTGFLIEVKEIKRTLQLKKADKYNSDHWVAEIEYKVKFDDGVDMYLLFVSQGQHASFAFEQFTLQEHDQLILERYQYAPAGNEWLMPTVIRDGQEQLFGIYGVLPKKI